MTFTSAVQSIRGDEAVKRESWNGYVFKRFAPDSAPDSKIFDLIFKTKDGAEFVYSFGTETKDVPMELSKNLVDGFIHDDWIRGTIESFEKARLGSDF